MSASLIMLLLGAFFVVGGFLVAALAAYHQERTLDRLAQRPDMRSFVFENLHNPSGAIRLGGLISVIVGLGCWVVDLIYWLATR